MNLQSFTKIQNLKIRNFNLGSLIPKSFNSGLCLCILTLLGVGLVQVYSSSYIFATESLGDGLYFFKKQCHVAAGILKNNFVYIFKT
jgi:cell division protein FtsW (lipid II flippase)